MKDFLHMVEHQLVKEVQLESIDPSDPIIIKNLPENWTLLGNGNYAAVFCHKSFPDLVVKIYAEGKEGIEEETEVYKKLGKHKSFSQMYCTGKRYLILKRLPGKTFYECMRRGIRFPKQAIEDIDNAIIYAKSVGLNPHDIHAKNIMVHNERGYIVDVSDFLHKDYCRLWKDTKKFYYKVYNKLPFVFSVPEYILNSGRKIYRLSRKIKKIIKNL